MTRKVLRRGAYMKRKGSVWAVKLLKDGVIHLVRDDTGEVDRVTVKKWQAECSEGTTEMVGDPNAGLQDDEKAIRQVALSDLPGNMRASALKKNFYVTAFRESSAFYDKFFPQVAQEERIRPCMSRPVLRPFAKLVADAFNRAHATELVQLFERPGATARGRKKAVRDAQAVPAHFLRDPSFNTYNNWVKAWDDIMVRNGQPDARLIASRYDKRGPDKRTMAPEVEGWLEEAIDTTWLTPSKNKKVAVYNRLRELVSDHNDKNPGNILTPPDQRHVRRLIDQTVDQETAMRRRLGDEEANRYFALVGEGPTTTNVLEIVEVDHTRVDADVIDDLTGAKLGRPWKTTALDRATGVPVGLVVHFDGPCLSANMRVLHDVMSPKDYIKNLVPELDYDYPGYGVPEAFFFDRGSDFDNDYMREVANEFDIRIDYEPGRHPHYKGRIERWHRTSSEQVDHPLPGATPPKDKDGYRRDPEGKAYITLSDYYARLWRWIAMVYMKSPHRGLNTTPLKAWQARENLRLPRPLPSKRALNLLLTRTELLSPRNTGVQFKNLRWNGAALRRIRALPGFKSTDKVRVRIDESNLGIAWVVNPLTRGMEPLDPVYKSYMPGRTLYQHRMALLYADEQLEGARDEPSLLEAIRTLGTEADALFKTAGQAGKSKAAVARHAGRRPKVPESETPAEPPVDISSIQQMIMRARDDDATPPQQDDDVLPTRELRKRPKASQ